MELTKVKKLARQIRGVSYKPEDLHDSLDDSAVILLRANNIDDGKINFDDVVYVDKSKVSDDQYLLPGDILICASSGSKQLVGKAASVNFDKPCTFGAFCKVVRPNSGLERYLGAYFQSSIYRRKISAVAIGANINNIRNEHIDELELPLCGQDESQSIVTKMELLHGIIGKRKAELDKLDELIKARFVEMFGDPVSTTNEQKADLEEICEKITDGEHGSVTRISEGHPFLNAKHILKNGKIDWNTITFIGDDDHKRIYKRCNPEEGDILLTTTGTIGNVAIMPVYEEVSMDRGITLLKIDHKKVTSEFVAELLKQPSVQAEMGVNVHASAIGHLFMNKVKKLPAIIPSMDKQIEFTDFVKQVDKSKVAVQKALDEAQLLFDSLMQEFFG